MINGVLISQQVRCCYFSSTVYLDATKIVHIKHSQTAPWEHYYSNAKVQLILEISHFFTGALNFVEGFAEGKIEI